MGYWMYDWLDSKNATTLHAAQAALADTANHESLREAASLALPSLSSPKVTGESLVAGRGLDLSGALDCVHPECRLKQVDRLLGRVWHYFDQVVVSDPVCRSLASCSSDIPQDLLEMTADQAQLVLHLRAIGAEPLLVFQDKPLPQVCSVHWRFGAQTAGIAETLDTAEQLVELFAREANIQIKNQTTEGIQFSIEHPLIVNAGWYRLDQHAFPKNMGETELRRAMAESVIGYHVVHLASDISAARQTGTALGSILPVYRRLLTDVVHESTERDVAFHLELPVVSGIPLESLLKLRTDEREYFERFRRALKKAVRERIKENQKGSPRSLAQEIYDDLIDPELTKIRDRLSRSVSAATRKAAIGASVSALATTCGLVAGATPAVAILAGVGALGASLYNAVSKHIDEDSEARSSSMYFLWKAERDH